jgi:hypothetical protein
MATIDRSHIVLEPLPSAVSAARMQRPSGVTAARMQRPSGVTATGGAWVSVTETGGACVIVPWTVTAASLFHAHAPRKSRRLLLLRHTQSPMTAIDEYKEPFVVLLRKDLTG